MFKFGLEGVFSVKLLGSDGALKFESEFTNLILDAGLERMGVGSTLVSHCQVGAGTSTPVNTQTQLDSFIAGTSALVAAVVSGSSPSAPHYHFTRSAWRFPAAAGNDNLSEIGMGWANSGSLFSRTRIKDGGGSPTTISRIVGDILEVTYELRSYLPTTDAINSLSLVSSSHDVTRRAAKITTPDWVNLFNGILSLNQNADRAYNGALGAATSTPSGITFSPSANWTLSYPAYVGGSYQRIFRNAFNIDAANLSGGIRSLLIHSNLGAFQFEFNPPIDKTADKTLTLDVAISWARYVA